MVKPIILNKRVSLNNSLTYIGFTFTRMPNPESTTIKAYFKINSKANAFQLKTEKDSVCFQIYYRNTRAKCKFCEENHTFLLAVGQKPQNLMIRFKK